MKKLGASAAVVYGTAGDRLLCHPSFTPVWDELHRSGLPLCVHMGMSYPPFAEVCNGLLDAHGIGMSLPAQMAFVAIVGHGMLDRYPNLKIGFLEFGAEWILYMVARLDHYLPIDRSQMPIKTEVPQRTIEDYAKSGRIFSPAKPTIKCCRRKSSCSAKTRFSTPPTCRTAKAATTRRKKFSRARILTSSKSARFSTTTRLSSSASRESKGVSYGT